MQKSITNNPLQSVHAIISTHTPRYLHCVLKALDLQVIKPASITVSCDVDNPEIFQVVETFASQSCIQVFLCQRPHQGIMRLAQVRNNAVRTLKNNGVQDGILLFLDGDMVLHPTCTRLHASLGGSGHLTLANRINLTQEATPSFIESLIASTRLPEPTGEDIKTLLQAKSRCERQIFWKKIGLGKAHKPQILGAHFSISLTDYEFVNGSDEEYQGYGCEDDDLARRAYKAGISPILAHDKAFAWHLFHPSSATVGWKNIPGAKRFLQNGWLMRPIYGLDNPLPDNPLSEFTLTHK